MGSGFSFFKADPVVAAKPGLGDLPESCAAEIMGYLEPLEICKLAKMNRAFRGASLADFIWEAKLPKNYKSIVSKVLGDGLGDLRTRDVYERICRPNGFDGGAKTAWLDKSTGSVCLLISSKGLAITGIDDRRYWNHISSEESRFSTVAYLQQIWWFEVDGEVEFPLPAGKYSMFFRLKLGRSSQKMFGRQVCNTEHVHGWDKKPVSFQLWTSEGQHASSECFLTETRKWNHYHVGDFVVENPNAATKLKFLMTQIDCTHTKGGLCLDSVVVYPSEFRERLKQF